MFAETRALVSLIFIIFIDVLLLWLQFIPNLLSYTHLAVVLASILVQRRVAAGAQCTVCSDLSGKIAVVTGSNSGIGEETACALAQMGCTVIYACRSEKKARYCMKKVTEFTNTMLYFAALDLGDLESVRDCVKQIEAILTQRQACGLDFLINNGGCLFPLNFDRRSKSGHELHIGTNFIGHVLLTELLLPDVVRAKGRVVNLSSSTIRWTDWSISALERDGRMNTLPLFSLLRRVELMVEVKQRKKLTFGYAASKWMNCVYTKYLAKRVKANGVIVTSVHPGCCATEITRVAVLSFLTRTIGLLCLKTAKEGAQTTLHCALATTGIVTGSYYADSANRDDMVPAGKLDNAADIEACMKYCFESLKMSYPKMD